MTRETQLPLPAAFFSVPLSFLLYFFSFCTFSHSAPIQSFLLCSLASSPFQPVATSNLCRAACPVYLLPLMSSPLLCVALHPLKLQILRTSLLKRTHFPLLSVCLCIRLPLLTPFPPPPCLLHVVTSSGAPSLLPTPIVLSQLGCGLDGSGPPLPSPRLHQQHQPQIQVIQQL